jgi:hypothetical protein
MYNYFNNIPNDGFLGWNRVGIGLMVTVVIFLLIIYIFIFCDLELSKSGSLKKIRNYLYSCPIPCKKDNIKCNTVNSYRGNNYGFDPNINGEKVRTYESCIFTGWEVSHLILHTILGFFTNIYISQSLSVGFEVYEHYSQDCGSFNDLGINFFGYCIGLGLKTASGYNNSMLPNNIL